MNKNLFLILIGILVGVAAGAWTMRIYFDRTLVAWNPADRFLFQLTEDLQLTADQRAKVSDILARQKDRMEDLRKQWRFEVVTLDRQGEDEIAGLLTTNQTDKFMRAHDQIHGRMDRFLWTTSAGPTAIAIAPSGK